MIPMYCAALACTRAFSPRTPLIPPLRLSDPSNNCVGRCDRKQRWRDFCARIIGWRWFDRGVLTAIAISSIALAIDRPEIGNGSPERYVLKTLELVLNGVFLAEAVLKIGAAGFVKYIRVGWNKLDFFIVCTSVIAFALPQTWHVYAFRVVKYFQFVMYAAPDMFEISP